MVTSVNVRQLAEAQFATPRVVLEVDLPGIWQHSITLREVLAGVCGLIVLLSAAGAARGEMRGAPGLLAAMCVPWLAGAMLLDGGGERWLILAACLSAGWAAMAGEWVIVHLGLAGIALLVSLGARTGSAATWIEATRPAWIWVAMLAMLVALAGALTARRRRA